MGSFYPHLSLDERRKIAKWLEAKMPISEIADRLGRDASTIYRDIKRNRYTDKDIPELNGYHALVAQDKYEQRRAVHRKMVVHPELKAAIEGRLKAGWSPEQIAGRMRLERHPIRVSHETIYRFAYSKDGRAEQFYRHLPEHRKARRPRRARKRQKPTFDRDVSILFRPDDVAHRRQFGHWEADLVLFKQRFGQSNVTSLVERVSRFTVLLKNPNKRTKPVMGKIMKAVRDLPLLARKSITFDRGTEFVSWPHLQAEIGTQTWFCDPSLPYQKCTVENTNRRARRWLPRKRDITAVSDHELKMICDRLNNTPRKCLGWKTPAEVFREKMMEEMGQSPYPQCQ